jgi:hypothetical protein
MRRLLAFAFVLGLAATVRGGEEKIRGLLEKTVKPGACAQITDALAETYYINKTDEAEKLVASFVGKNEKVVITGVVEQKEGDPSYYFVLKSVEPYAPKLPPAPASAASPAPDPKAAAPAPAPDSKAPAPAPAPAPEGKDEKK